MGLHTFVVITTGVFCAISAIVSAALIQKHMAHFSKPLIQSKIVGILWMVPIYSIDSWLSLSFKNYALYLDMFRDCYEAYVLYLFLALLVAYLGDGDEFKVMSLMEQQPRIEHMYPFKLVLKGDVPHGAEFLKFCKFGTMQYIVLKPTCTICAVILSACGLYGEGTFALNRFWVYQIIIMNISVGYAFYCLGLFYLMLHDPLGKFNPVPKFLCIKAVLFLSFWQGVIIAALVRLGLLPHMGDWTTQNVALAIQDVLVCFEMMLVGFAHRHAFPYQPYIGAPTLRTSLLEDHFAHSAALRDFNEVMPVLLPGQFRPGLAQSIEHRRMDISLHRLAGDDEKKGREGEGTPTTTTTAMQHAHYHHDDDDDVESFGAQDSFFTLVTNKKKEKNIGGTTTTTTTTTAAGGGGVGSSGTDYDKEEEDETRELPEGIEEAAARTLEKMPWRL